MPKTFIKKVLQSLEELLVQSFGSSNYWWMLLNFVPYIGGIIVLVWFCLKGTIGPNEFDDESDRVPPSISV